MGKFVMRITGKYTQNVHFPYNVTKWKPKLFGYLIPSHTCMETVERSQNSIAGFGLAEVPLVLDAHPETGDILNIKNPLKPWNCFCGVNLNLSKQY